MILIWDTCAINSVCRAIADYVRHSGAVDIALTAQGGEFLSTLDELMDGLEQRCGHSSHTSELVFDIEMDPNAVDSKLRNQHELVESFCGQGSFIGDWAGVLDGRIAAEPTMEDEIDELRSIIQPDPGQRDASLIVAALKLSAETGQDCVIVTDDFPLIRRINELKRTRKEVFLGVHQYSTTRITAKLSLEILHELYISCGTDHAFWQAAIFSFTLHYPGSPEQKHQQMLLTLFENIHRDRREKELLNLGPELEGAFGDEDA